MFLKHWTVIEKNYYKIWDEFGHLLTNASFSVLFPRPCSCSQASDGFEIFQYNAADSPESSIVYNQTEAKSLQILNGIFFCLIFKKVLTPIFKIYTSQLGLMLLKYSHLVGNNSLNVSQSLNKHIKVVEEFVTNFGILLVSTHESFFIMNFQ